MAYDSVSDSSHADIGIKPNPEPNLKAFYKKKSFSIVQSSAF